MIFHSSCAVWHTDFVNSVNSCEDKTYLHKLFRNTIHVSIECFLRSSNFYCNHNFKLRSIKKKKK